MPGIWEHLENCWKFENWETWESKLTWTPPKSGEQNKRDTPIWQRLFCLVVKTWTYLSTNIDRQMDIFSKITCHFPGLFFLQKFYRLFLVIPCFHIAKGDIWAPLVSSRGRSHTIPCHMMTAYDTAAICQSMLVENDVRMGGLLSWNRRYIKIQ